MYRELRIAIALLVMMLVVLELVKRLDRAGKCRNLVILGALLLYFGGVIYAVGFRGNRKGISSVIVQFPSPLWTAIKTHRYGKMAIQSILNLLLFIPFGYLLPQLKPLKWYQMIGLGFLTSLLIETCKLVFHFGGFELDDLVKNTMGAAFGWLLYAGLDKFHKKYE